MQTNRSKQGGRRRRPRATGRDQLIVRWLPLVRRIAVRLKVELPGFVDLDDLIQDGTLGLLDASRNYDPACGVSFEVFAHPRIRGAMVDGLRRFEFAPRLVEKRARRVAQVTEAHRQEHGRPPCEAELLDRLLAVAATARDGRGGEGVSREGRFKPTFRADLVLLDGARVSACGSLDAPVEDRAGPPPDERAMRAELRRALFAHMTSRERQVFTDYAINCRSIAQTGRRHGLSDSGVHRIVDRVRARLRERADLRALAGVEPGPLPVVSVAQIRRYMNPEAEGAGAGDGQGRRRTDAAGRRRGMRPAAPPAQDGPRNPTSCLGLKLGPRPGKDANEQATRDGDDQTVATA